MKRTRTNLEVVLPALALYLIVLVCRISFNMGYDTGWNDGAANAAAGVVEKGE